MASGMYEFGTSNPYIFGHLYWDSTSNGSVANSTFMTIRVYFFRTNGYTTWGTMNTSVQCDNGVQSENGYSISFSTSEVIAYAKNFTVPHNPDGTKALYIRCCGDCDSGFTFDANWSFWLESIPRYATITKFQQSSVGLTSANFEWGVDVNCDWLSYSLNDGAWVDTSGTPFNITNLQPETSYSIKIRVRRHDSQLWTTSNNISFTTLPIVKLATKSFNVNIGSNVTFSFINKDNNASQLQFFTAPASGGSWTHRQDVSIPAGTATYTWSTASIANIMYAEAPNTNTMRILVYCRYDSTRLTECQGTGIVTNSNPTFSNFAFSNTDTNVTSIVGNNMLTYIGNLRITIPESNKAVAKNSASMSYYNIAISANGNIIASKKANYSSTNLDIDVGTFGTSGTYTLMVDAVDSRGNASSVVQKQIIFYPYHSPTPTINLRRYGGFEKEIQLSLSALFSRVVIDSTEKNSIQYIKYRYCETGSALPPSYKDITPYSTTIIGNDNKISYAKEAIDDFFINDLDRTKSYEFEFVFKDSFKETVSSVSLLQGKPITTILDNNKTLINVIPTENVVTDDKANLFVGGDIKANDTYILETLYRTGIYDRSMDNHLNDALYINVNVPSDPFNMKRWGVNNLKGWNNPTVNLPLHNMVGMREIKYYNSSNIVAYIYETVPLAGRVWSNRCDGVRWLGWNCNMHPEGVRTFFGEVGGTAGLVAYAHGVLRFKPGWLCDLQFSLKIESNSLTDADGYKAFSPTKFKNLLRLSGFEYDILQSKVSLTRHWIPQDDLKLYMGYTGLWLASLEYLGRVYTTSGATGGWGLGQPVYKAGTYMDVSIIDMKYS